MTESQRLFQILNPSPERACWHLWTVLIPRRLITGRPVWGRVWRRHDRRRWIYKKFVEYADGDC
jgi:ribosomal protein L35AE/L33A